MKTQIFKLNYLIWIIFSMGTVLKAQDSIVLNQNEIIKTHSQIFSLSPVSKKVHQVNGLVFGAGFFDNQYIKKQTINGINLEVNPSILVAPIVIIHLPEIIAKSELTHKISDSIVTNENTNLKLKINGLNISSGQYFNDTSINGFSITGFTRFETCNGLNIAALFTFSGEMNGISISLLNTFNKTNGVSIGLINRTYELKGLQIGLFNASNHNKGLQIGFWNTNSKRSMPFINW
jgi:hypothetical protein